MAEHRKLLLRDRPKADESLLGFIVRLTELNDYDTPTWIVQEAKLGDIWYQCPFVKKHIDIEPLAKLSGRSVAELKHLLYLPADGSSKFLTPRVILSQTVPTYVIRIQNPKICPACIGEFRYCRKVWDLAPLTCCPIHRCLLLAECPKCKRRIRWSRNSISRCPQPCGYNWADAPLQIVDDIGLALSRQIHLLCGLPTGKALHQEVIAGTPLAGLKLEHLISSVAFIASQLGGFIDTKWKFFVSIRENERIHHLLTKALLVFTNWPDNFFSFLNWRRLQTPKDLSGGFNNEFNEYRNALYQQLSPKHFDFLRDAFEEYLVAHWDGGHASQLRRLRNIPVQLRKYVSQREAKDLLSTTWQAISKYVAVGRLSAIEKGRGRGRVHLIEASSVLRLVEDLNNGLCMAQVREKLALHDMRVKELIEGGILNPLSGPAIGVGDWRFKAQEVNALIAKIEDTLPNKASTPKRERINLWQTLRKLGSVGLRLDALISAVINQEIPPCAKTGPGISGLLFSHKSVDEYVSRNAKFLDDYLSLEDVRKALNVSDAAIRHLVNIGLLRAEKKEGMRCLGRLIAKSDLNHFTSNYVFAGKIARALGTDAGFLTKLLGSRGARPITGPRIDDGMVNLFRKADVENLDLSDIVATAKVRIAITRKEAFLVNAAAAAKRLNISEHEIERLVDDGMLRPYRRGSYKNRADGPYFTEDMIGQYKERRSAYDGLVSTQTAITDRCI